MKNSIKGMRISASIFCLFCILFFGISSHSEKPIPESEDYLTVTFEEKGKKVYGYGYVWVGDLNVYEQDDDLPQVAESRHTTSFYHYLVESNVKCDYIFVTKVAVYPQVNLRQKVLDLELLRSMTPTRILHTYLSMVQPTI